MNSHGIIILRCALIFIWSITYMKWRHLSTSHCCHDFSNGQVDWCLCWRLYFVEWLRFGSLWSCVFFIVIVGFKSWASSGADFRSYWSSDYVSYCFVMVPLKSAPSGRMATGREYSMVKCAGQHHRGVVSRDGLRCLLNPLLDSGRCRCQIGTAACHQLSSIILSFNLILYHS